MNKLFSLLFTLALLPACCRKKERAQEPKETKRTVVKEVTTEDVTFTTPEAEVTAPEELPAFDETETLEISEVAMPEEEN